MIDRISLFMTGCLTESSKSHAWLRGAISSGWGVACIISEINSLMIWVMGK